MKINLGLFTSGYYDKIKNYLEAFAQTQDFIKHYMIETIKKTKVLEMAYNIKAINREQIYLPSLLQGCIPYSGFFKSVLSCPLELWTVVK